MNLHFTKKEKADLKRKCKEHLKFFKKEGEDGLPYSAYVPLERIDDNDYAIVFGYLDGYDEEDAQITDGYGNYCLNGKVGYQSENSIMTEFEVDWLMPYNEENCETWDTCLTLDPSGCESGIDWLIEQAEYILRAVKLNLEMQESYEEDEDECDFLYRMAEKGYALEDFKNILVDRYEWAHELAKTHAFGFPDEPNNVN